MFCRIVRVLSVSCISTSFQVLHTSKSWSKYFLWAFSNFFVDIKSSYLIGYSLARRLASWVVTARKITINSKLKRNFQFKFELRHGRNNQSVYFEVLTMGPGCRAINWHVVSPRNDALKRHIVTNVGKAYTLESW